MKALSYFRKETGSIWYLADDVLPDGRHSNNVVDAYSRVGSVADRNC